MISYTGIRKPLNLSKGLAIDRSPEGIEFLISRWSTESHNFIATWDEFCLTLEDIVVFTIFPCLEKQRPSSYLMVLKKISLDGEGERKLEALNKALSKSKTKTKRTYSSWVNYFTHRAEAMSDIEF